MAFLLTGGVAGTPGSTGAFVRINHIGNVNITGDLTVTSLIATDTITTGDNIIVLNDDVTGVPSENAGIEVNRGTSTDARLLWDEGSDRWTAGLTGAQGLIFVSNEDLIPDTNNFYDLGSPSNTFKELFVNKLTVGSTPVYTVTNALTDRTYDANLTSVDEIADILGTLISDLQTKGLLG